MNKNKTDKYIQDRIQQFIDMYLTGFDLVSMSPTF